MKDNQQVPRNRAIDKIAGARKVEVKPCVEVKQLGRGSGAFSIMYRRPERDGLHERRRV
jgi:hypothetical protein